MSPSTLSGRLWGPEKFAGTFPIFFSKITDDGQNWPIIVRLPKRSRNKLNGTYSLTKTVLVSFAKYLATGKYFRFYTSERRPLQEAINNSFNFMAEVYDVRISTVQNEPVHVRNTRDPPWNSDKFQTSVKNEFLLPEYVLVMIEIFFHVVGVIHCE